MNSKGRMLLVLTGMVSLLQCVLHPEYSMSESVRVADLAQPVDISEDSVLDPGSPQVVFNALIKAYPDKLSSLEYRDGDWSILAGGEPYYWAGGRILAESNRADAEHYLPYQFNPDSGTPLLHQESSSEKVEQIKEILNQMKSLKNGRSPDFMTALWGMNDSIVAEKTTINTIFLGFQIRVHPEIKDALKLVELEIFRKAESDDATKRWLENLGSAGAYAWRKIAGSENRSLHSYGIAIDLIPKDYHGKQAYWRWTADYYEEWWSIPYNERFQVPESVVKAFKKNGFVWGGQWLLFDQIHFEYRPELIVLGDIARNNPPPGRMSGRF